MTEFTVSPTGLPTNLGPKAMPADLPPASGYTYAVDLDLAEGATHGLSTVTFNQAVFFYIEQLATMPSFPNGTAVPTGYYDRAAGSWVPSPNGEVITFTASTHACNDGSGGCSSIPAAELTELAAAYSSYGATAKQYWRVPVTHFTAYDTNWAFGPATSDLPPPGIGPNDSGELPVKAVIHGVERKRLLIA